ncbi:MAG: substrate-binding domain-containing protein, partial [Tissierellia bacterium]|nr:substrate-binding domain-containing protein [Tissierellia bacterium]
MKKKITLLLAGIMVLGVLTSCGKKDDGGNEGAQTDGDQKKIAVVAKGFQHQFWKAVEQGTQKAGEEFNAEIMFQGPDNESAISQQIEYLNAAIDQDPDAICFAALDTQASLDSISNALEKEIPIIGFDSGVPDAPEGAVKANASTDNYAAATIAAEKMYELIQDQVTDPQETVRIGVLSQESNSQSIVDRTKGFIDRLSELIGEDQVSVEGHQSLANK